MLLEAKVITLLELGRILLLNARDFRLNPFLQVGHGSRGSCLFERAQMHLCFFVDLSHALITTYLLLQELVLLFFHLDQVFHSRVKAFHFDQIQVLRADAASAAQFLAQVQVGRDIVPFTVAIPLLLRRAFLLFQRSDGQGLLLGRRRLIFFDNF